MKSILAIVDKPGWSVDNQTSQVISGLSQFLWTKIFHQAFRGPNVDLPGLIKAHDIVWCTNHGTARKLSPILTAVKPPRVVVTFRSWRYRDDIKPFITSGVARAVTAISPDLTEHVMEFFPACRYIPDAVPDFFKPSRPRRIGFVGEPDEYKGFPLIEDAVARCGFELFVAPMETDPLIGNRRGQDEMPRFYEMCDAVVVASEQEGGGTIAMEAMAMNVPVLTTRVGLASNLDCLYVDRSVDGIEAGLRRLFGRSKVFPEFSVENVNRQYAALFEELLNL